MSNDELDTEPIAWRATAWHWAIGLSLLIHGLAALLMLHYGGALAQRGEAAVLSVQLLAPTRAQPEVAAAAEVKKSPADELPSSEAPEPAPPAYGALAPTAQPAVASGKDVAVLGREAATVNPSSAVTTPAASMPATLSASLAKTPPAATVPPETPVDTASAPLTGATVANVEPTVGREPEPGPASAHTTKSRPDESGADAQTTQGEQAVLRRRADPPPARRLDYALSARSRGMNYQVTSTLLWARDGTHYRLENQGGAFLLGGFTFISQGEITAAGLAPERYEEQRRRRNVATNFSRARGEVSFSASETKVPLTVGTQDRLSVLLQLAALAHADPKQLTTPPFVEIPVAGSKGVDPWRFQALALETLDTAMGPLETIHLRRLPRRDDWDQQVDVWLAPALDGLPVRIRLTEPNGDYVLQEMTNADPLEGKAALLKP